MKGSEDPIPVNKSQDVCLTLVVEAMAERHGFAEQVFRDRAVGVGTETQQVHDVVGMSVANGNEVVMEIRPTGIVVALLGLLVVAKRRTTSSVRQVDGM